MDPQTSPNPPPPPSVKSILEDMDRAARTKAAKPVKQRAPFRNTWWWKAGFAVLLAVMFIPLILYFIPEKPEGHQFEGCFDGTEKYAVYGWAWDAVHPDDPISVEIDDKVHPKAVVLADQYRDDLKDAGKGNGKHAFRYVIPPKYRDGRQYTVSIRVVDSTVQLDQSPRAMTYAKSKSAKVR